ncbi:gamma-glutamyltranspeptidase domain-containing protein [Phthorimaea operculella]|nr:gamma-glutamyltranspeptidase domain-containing protein [Phthorimaea operculella]
MPSDTELRTIPEESFRGRSAKRSPGHPRRFLLSPIFYTAHHCFLRGVQMKRSILIQNGSAVDAAIASMFCNGILNQQSMGLGGGFFMTVYIRNEERAYTVDAREMAPRAGSRDMYHGNGDLAMKGPLSVAVPGELRGMWAAYQRWGKLPWASLIAPTLQICEDGFVISKVMFDGLETAAWIKNDPLLSYSGLPCLIAPTLQICEDGFVISKVMFEGLETAAWIKNDPLLSYSGLPCLIAPTLQICEDGFVISKVMFDGLETAAWIKNDPLLRKQYYNSIKNQFHSPGTVVKPSEQLCNTFRRIAEKGGDELYNGTLAKEFAQDLSDAKTIITEDDLRNYEAKIVDPLAVEINNGDILYTPPPPSSGVILANILNILSGYNFTSANMNSSEDKVLTYHRIVEAFKFAYGTRTKLGDMDFLNLTELINNATNPGVGTQIRLRINDSATSNDTAFYGAEEYNPADSGTAHISIIAPNGDAVSVTSSINFYYGAGFATKRTGIVMNNVMDDFSSPGVTNYFGLKPAEANFIEPRKRPLSSMTPSIIVDGGGNAKMVIGASGGTKITTAVALATIRILWFEQSIKEAVDAPRIHHQTIPMRIDYEYGLTEDIVAGLRAKGHGMERYRSRGSIVCALYRNGTAIYGNSDFRKGGDVSGLD